MLTPGEKFDGRYFVESILGVGGFAEVYRARDTVLQRTVALKLVKETLIDTATLALFESEARNLAALEHLNIVQIYDVRMVDGRPYLVEQYIEGQTLRSLIDNNATGKNISLELSLSYVSQLLSGLSHAHTQSKAIVHLDIKPNNLIVDANGRLTILDFGIAHIVGATPTDSTRFHNVLGTLPYMSPEQISGARIDARSDIFSAAVVLFELLTHKTPSQLRYSPADIVAALPPNRELRDIVMRGLEGDPNDRFPDALQMKSAIDAMSAKLAQSSVTRPKPSSPRRNVRFVAPSTFSRLLIERLGDTTTKTIQMICYTAEVDAALLNPYRIKTQKKVEVFKRSVIADLADQQDSNLRRLAEGHLPQHPWNKRRGSMQASQHMTAVALDPKLDLQQFLYNGPPSWRAYIFDYSEAVISYYEVAADNDGMEGAPFKGITAGGALAVTADRPIGKLILKGLLNFVEGLRRTSHDWDGEQMVLLGAADLVPRRVGPCTSPKVAMLDLDGTLYDSLPNYVTAWKVAFEREGIEIDPREIYEQEGRQGRDTVRYYLNRRGLEVADAVVERIVTLKNEVFSSLPAAPVQVGAKQLVEAISKSGLDIWVVTGSAQSDLDRRLRVDFQGRIPQEQVIRGRDVSAGKPSPMPYSLACRRANVYPHQAVAIENAPLGIESAARAGVYCIAVNTGILDTKSLYAAGARAVFRDCSHVAGDWETITRLLRE